MLDDVRDAGHTCGRQRVARLMRSAALRARPRRRARPTDTGERVLHMIAPNVLDRAFTALAPNQKWVADFTFVWTHEGWLYVAVVLDLFSRRVVGWAVPSLTSLFEVLPRSIESTQYTSEQFQQLLSNLGVTCSMSRSGNVWDNAVMESFFSTMKIERCHRTGYRTRDEARADVFDYIERFYNLTRRHSSLGNVSPIDFERMMAVA